LKGVELKGSLARDAKLLTEWDGRLSVDSKAGPLYAVWLRELQRVFYATHAPKELVPTLAALGGLPTMLAALESADPKWFGAANPKAARDKLLRETFERAVYEVAALPEEKQLKWGALHTATFRHPLASSGAGFAKAFDVGPFERPGDANTPNNTRHDD